MVEVVELAELAELFGFVLEGVGKNSKEKFGVGCAMLEGSTFSLEEERSLHLVVGTFFGL